MAINSRKAEEEGRINKEILIPEESSYNTINSGSEARNIENVYDPEGNLPKVNLPKLLEKLHSTPKYMKIGHKDQLRSLRGYKKLYLEEKLYIIEESNKSSLLEAGNYFNLSPGTISAWKRRLFLRGVRGIAPQSNKAGFISEKKKRDIHREVVGGMSRPQIMKKYGVKKYKIDQIMSRYKYGLNGPPRINIGHLEKLEIVKYAEEFGMQATLLKFKIKGPQFRQCYKKFGGQMEGGRRIVTLKDVKEMLKYNEDHDLGATLDKYCMGRDTLIRYYKHFGYRYIGRKWSKIHHINNIENIENRKREEAENTKNSYENENYSPRSTRSSLKTLTPHRSFSSIYSSELPLNSTGKFDLSETSSNLEFLDSKNNEENKELDIEDSEGNKLKPNQYMLGTIREIVLFAEENGENETMKNYSISYDTLATYCRIIYLDGVGGLHK